MTFVEWLVIMASALASGGIILWIWLKVMRDPDPKRLDPMSSRWLDHKDRHRGH